MVNSRKQKTTTSVNQEEQKDIYLIFSRNIAIF